MSDIVKKNLDDIPEDFKKYSQQASIKKESELSSDSNEIFLLLILFLICSSR